MTIRSNCGVLAATALLAGCGSDDAVQPSVAIEEFKFAPATLRVDVGTKVTFTNADRAPHTATAEAAFDTGVLAENGSKTVTITKTGTFNYVCELHPYMKGTLVVRP